MAHVLLIMQIVSIINQGVNVDILLCIDLLQLAVCRLLSK